VNTKSENTWPHIHTQSEESRRRATEHGWSQLHSPAPIAPISDSEHLDLEKEASRVHNLALERKKGRKEGKSGKGSFAQSGIEQDEKKEGGTEEKKEDGGRRKEGKPFEISGSSYWSRTGSVEEKMQDSTDITRTGSLGSAKSSGSTGSSLSAFSTVSAVSKNTRMAVNEYKEADQESNEKLSRLALAEVCHHIPQIFQTSQPSSVKLFLPRFLASPSQYLSQSSTLSNTLHPPSILTRSLLHLTLPLLTLPNTPVCVCLQIEDAVKEITALEQTISPVVQIDQVTYPFAQHLSALTFLGE
jgi:hypothetical protein